MEKSKSMNENNIQHWKSTFKTIYAKYWEKDMYSLWEDSYARELGFTTMYHCYSKLFSEQGI